MRSRFAFLPLTLLGFNSLQASAISITSSQFRPSIKLSSEDGSISFDSTTDVDGFGAVVYTSSVKLGGKEYEVLVDTGSSDLWLDTTGMDTSSFINTGMVQYLTYGDGTVAQGPVLIGNLTFGNYTVPQAFISASGTNATSLGDQGILGVGPPLLSVISQALNGSTFDGRTVQEHIFEADPALPPVVTFQLSRSDVNGTTDGGVFTFGEIDGTLKDVSNQPKLDVLSESDRWLVLMDGMIVNGKNITGGSSFPLPNTQQTIANLDTGTSLALVPKRYLDAIFSNVVGALFDRSVGLYQVPCDTKMNVSLVFGGQEYPIHPIDTVTAVEGSRGGVICASGFIAASDSDEDFLLGDTFLRNVYSLYDFGSLIDNTSTSAPFIQLLSTTTQAQGWSEFDSLSAKRNASILGKAAPPGSTTTPKPSSGAAASNMGAVSAWAATVILGVSVAVLGL